MSGQSPCRLCSPFLVLLSLSSVLVLVSFLFACSLVVILCVCVLLLLLLLCVWGCGWGALFVSGTQTKRNKKGGSIPNTNPLYSLTTRISCAAVRVDKVRLRYPLDRGQEVAPASSAGCAKRHTATMTV